MPIKFILDTDTLIYWMKNTPSVIGMVNFHKTKSLAACGISRAELYYGAYRSVHVNKNLNAIKYLSSKIKFLQLDANAQEFFGKIKAELVKTGNRLDDADLFIAATPLSTNKPLVTTNEKHFSRIPGLKIVNWFHK